MMAEIHELDCNLCAETMPFGFRVWHSVEAGGRLRGKNLASLREGWRATHIPQREFRPQNWADGDTVPNISGCGIKCATQIKIFSQIVTSTPYFVVCPALNRYPSTIV